MSVQYLIQCKCPAASEPARYPAEVEVMISACEEDEIVQISPSGRLLAASNSPSQLINLETKERTELPRLGGQYAFLTDDLLLVGDDLDEYVRDNTYVLDLKSTERHPLQQLYPLDLPAPEGNKIDPVAVSRLLSNAQRVFVVGKLIVALNVNSNNYLIDVRDLTDQMWDLALAGQIPLEAADGISAQQFLDEHQIPYTRSDQNFTDEFEWPSLSGAFIFRLDGIYLASTGQRIVENYQEPGFGYRYPVGWVYDDLGVILRPGQPFVIDFYFLLYMDLGWQFQYFELVQPVLMLKVPQEYLPAVPTPIP